MSPKSLLRHKLCVSSPRDLTEGSFQPVLGEIDPIEPAQVRRVLLCSGKVYYDLLAARRERDIDDIAIIRVEQLYPFPETEIGAALDAVRRQRARCSGCRRSRGTWERGTTCTGACGASIGDGRALGYAGRDAAASPAVGSYKIHSGRGGRPHQPRPEEVAMPIDVRIPTLGESVSEGVIVRWIKADGDDRADRRAAARAGNRQGERRDSGRRAPASCTILKAGRRDGAGRRRRRTHRGRQRCSRKPPPAKPAPAASATSANAAVTSAEAATPASGEC